MLSERIRIATWNCFGVPPSASDFFEGKPFWPERFRSRLLSETLSRYDIVCVQENLLEGVRESLDALRASAGFAELWFDPMGPDLEDGTFVGGGLAFLSRWPMRVRFSRLPRGAGPDGFARKGFALAEVILPSGRDLVVINTHLQADDHNVPIEQCHGARIEQIRILGETTRALRALGTPVVLCGDFNVAHDSDEYAALHSNFGEHLIDLVTHHGVQATYDVMQNDLAAVFHPGGPTRAVFDYVWVSRGPFVVEEVRTILDEPLPDVGPPPPPHSARPFSSDHFGVGVTLELRGGGANDGLAC